MGVREEGSVKWFNDAKGFGFISRAWRRGSFPGEDLCEVASRCRVGRIVQEGGNGCRDLLRGRLRAQTYAGAVPKGRKTAAMSASQRVSFSAAW